MAMKHHCYHVLVRVLLEVQIVHTVMMLQLLVHQVGITYYVYVSNYGYGA